MQENLNRGLVVTTHYSGVGTAEKAVAIVADGNAAFHSACDLNSACREVLLHHEPDSAPEHVFDDLCARPPAPIVDQLRAKLKTFQAQIHARTSTSSTGAESAQDIQQVGVKWVTVAMEVLAQWEPTRHDSAFCHRHGRACPTCPPRGDKLHIEISGINCQPWSSAGKRWGWLDDRSIPCLILVRLILQVRPHAVCIECTPDFDFESLRRLLTGYRGDFAIMCPTDFGLPVRRRRKYMWFDDEASLGKVHAQMRCMMDMCRRSLLIGPEVFLRASPADMQRHYYQMAQKASGKHDGPPKPVLRRLAGKQAPNCNLGVRDVLTPKARERYEAHRAKLDRVQPSTCCIVDINVSPQWGGPPQSRHCPTILRSSTMTALYSSGGQDRLLLPQELPAIHGLRLPPTVLPRLPEAVLRSLVGNSMHAAQVGSFVQHALATRSWRRPDSASTPVP